jgi:hypothetical protein
MMRGLEATIVYRGMTVRADIRRLTTVAACLRDMSVLVGYTVLYFEPEGKPVRMTAKRFLAAYEAGELERKE